MAEKEKPAENDGQEKTLGEGILKDVTKLVIETDEDEPKPIVVFSPDYVDIVDTRYRVRMTPKYT